MTIQQVNLYLPEFRPQKDWLRLEYGLLVIGLVIIFLVLSLANSSNKLTAIKTDVGLLEERQAVLDEKIAKLKVKPSGAEREELQKKTEVLRAAIKNRKAVAEVITGKSLGNRLGFARNLTAMSEELIPGISLTGFRFTQGGRYVGLTGSASKPELIPLYVSQLQDNAAFSSSRFGQLAIFESDGRAGFSLSGEKDVSMMAEEMSRRVGATQ